MSEQTAIDPLADLTVDRFTRRGIVTCAPEADLREVACAIADSPVEGDFR
jgi:hypothetical protein